ncbi:MFS transporter [Streptomyces sp. 150FB]|uniref:MFS transporter n=1 Tax=Streptomyces sp. 150FB TaxID=1576605 RepID=UPI00099D64B6|nr:MFS transporter [Streptomyces sp. 150FB]
MTTEQAAQDPAAPLEPGVPVEALSRQQWRWSVLAGMASYLDAGSIVALGAGLSLFQERLQLSDSGFTGVGALAAIGPNAIGAAIGAFIGGRLGDKLGRKRIYQWDLLVYALAVLCIGFAVTPAMIFIGTFAVGLAVGADVPTSLALVGEFSPAKSRGKLLGLTQVAWNAGPIVVLLLALGLSPLGLLGIRIVFVHLFVVALITWALRKGMTESPMWKAAAEKGAEAKAGVRELFKGPNLRAMLWTGTIYVFSSLAAGTAGIFTPYMVRHLGAGDQTTSVALSCSGFVIGILATCLVFMRFSDRDHGTRRLMWGVGAVLGALSYALFLVFPFTIPTILLNTFFFGVGAALAGEAFYKTFSQELFPTMLRGTAQGFTFGTARFFLGIWSYFVPHLASTGIAPVAGLLTAFLIVSGGVGFFFMPDTAGKSLDLIQTERKALA